MRRIALLLIFCWPFFAWSQEPAPSGGEATQPQQAQSAQPDHSAAANQQPTAQPPIIVNVPPAHKAEAEAEEERRERKEKADLDRRLVDLTGELAWFTAGLFFATAALVIATIGLGYFAYRQARDMKESIRLAKRSADLSERALVNLDRAFLYVEPNLVKPITNESGTGRRPITDPQLHFRLVNYGKRPAFVWVCVTEIRWFDELPRIPKYGPKPPVQVMIGPEARWSPAQPVYKDESLLGDAAIRAVRNQVKVPYFFGYVVYDDHIGVRYTRGFCYTFAATHDPNLGDIRSFTQVGGQAYNYERAEKIEPGASWRWPD